MGCVYSQPKHRSRSSANSSSTADNPRVFHVCNVDDRGTEINFGKIEITDNELALHQKGRNSIYWPLRSLRRYGFDAELFSFECGRRCPTGAGIYAFKCTNAETLFNTLQEAIQQCTTNQYPIFSGGPVINGGEALSGQHNSSLPPPDTGPRNARVPAAPHLYSNDIHEYINSPFYVNTPALIGQQTANNNAGQICFQTANTPLPVTAKSDVNTNYAKLDDLVRFYVNIKTPQSPPHSPASTSDEPVNYIMLDLDKSNSASAASQPTIVTTAPATPVSKTPTMDYPPLVTQTASQSASVANNSSSTTPPNPSTPTSTTSPQQYATIDFDKTVALSNSAANHRKV